MVALRINGEESGIGQRNGLRMADLVELIKASIDPAHMITRIVVDGQELEEADWTRVVESFGTSIIEVDTDTPRAFVQDRFGRAAAVISNCFHQFREARKCFAAGDMASGNKKLVTAVNTLKQFFEWYSTLLELVPEDQRPTYDITPQVREISDVCKRICQQQLYQSWWALGETIKKELEPQLDKLEDFCSGFAVAA